MTFKLTALSALFSSALIAFGQNPPPPPNEAATITYHPSTATWRITWLSRLGWSYFVVTSPDLKNWFYLLEPVKIGSGGSMHSTLNTSNRLFARLRFAYRPAGNPAAGDSDGDGLSDLYEITHSLDPLDIDPNGDGVPDNLTPISGTSLPGVPVLTLFSPPGATPIP